MEHVLFNVQINKYLHLAFCKGIRKKVLINYMRHSSTINIRFMCNVYRSRMSSWLIFLAKNHFFYWFNVPFCTYILFEQRHQSLHLFQQFLSTRYVSFLFWMNVSNSCGTMLIVYPKKNLYLFSFTYGNTIMLVASNLMYLNDEQNWLRNELLVNSEMSVNKHHV